MNLRDVALDYGSLVRARGRAFKRLDDEFDGNRKSEFNQRVAALNDSFALLMSAHSGQEVNGIRAETSEYDGKDAILVHTDKHKIVLLKVGASSELFRAVHVFHR